MFKPAPEKNAEGKPAQPGKRGLFLVFLLLPISTVAFYSPTERLDFSPFLRIEPDSASWQALGPLLELSSATTPEEDLQLALPRPLFTFFRDHAGTVEGWDAVWPLAASRHRPDGSYLYFLNFIHTSKSEAADSPRTRWWLWPLFFAGRDNQGEPYSALFPVGGKIANLGLADEVKFILFPLYSRSAKGNMTQHSILWPIFSLGHSDNRQKWRVFPLYGVNRDQDGVQRFMLWPLIHSGKTAKNDYSSKGFFLFPLYGEIRQLGAGQEVRSRARTILWPFFKFEKNPAGQKIHLPWPFFQYETSGQFLTTGEKLYFWPFLGRQTRADSEYGFLLWPIFHQRKVEGVQEQTRMKWIAPFWQSTRIINRQTGETKSVNRRLWPLFSHRRKLGLSELTVLNLWPTPPTPAIQRNYAPLWQLYHYSATPDSSRHNLLWGFWKRTKTDSSSRHRLFPLFDYERKSEGGGRLSLLAGLIDFTRAPGSSMESRWLWIIEP